MNWNDYFMNLVYMVALKSKDKETKIGAVLTRQDNSIISTGYNSFPMGLDDNVEARQERPEKYFWFSHAETNAICLAANHGTSTDFTTLYTNGIPCADCARSIIQAGIVKVVYDVAWQDACPEKWVESSERSKIMFYECGVGLEGITFKRISPIKFIRGRCI